LGLDSFSDELLGQLLEWSPTVIVTPHTAEKVHAFGIKIDWIITDQLNLQLQSDIKLMPVGTDTNAEAAIKYLITNGYSAVNIITDEVQLKDYLFYIDKINMVIYHRNQKIYAVNSGFSKWKPADETIQLISEPLHLCIDGLEPLENNQFKTTRDGFFTLQFTQPFLFIAEYL
jgi:thiamine pyrophosphokinase